jgi:hypothetical protein
MNQFNVHTKNENKRVRSIGSNYDLKEAVCQRRIKLVGGLGPNLHEQSLPSPSPSLPSPPPFMLPSSLYGER